MVDTNMPYASLLLIGPLDADSCPVHSYLPRDAASLGLLLQVGRAGVGDIERLRGIVWFQ